MTELEKQQWARQLEQIQFQAFELCNVISWPNDEKTQQDVKKVIAFFLTPDILDACKENPNVLDCAESCYNAHIVCEVVHELTGVTW